MFGLAKIEIYIMAGFAVLMLLGGVYAKIYHDGVKAERARIEAQAARDGAAARQIERDAGACDRAAGCVLSDPFRMPDLQRDKGK